MKRAGSRLRANGSVKGIVYGGVSDSVKSVYGGVGDSVCDKV